MKSKSKIIFATIAIIAFSTSIIISCAEEGAPQEAAQAQQRLLGTEYSFLKNFDLKQISSSTIDATTKKYTLTYWNGKVSNIYVKKSSSQAKVYETGGTREVVFDNSLQDVLFYSGGVETTHTAVNFDDMIYVAYVNFSGKIPNPTVHASSRCIHTAISIRWRKSLTVQNAQTLIDNYLAAHSDCQQLGGLDTACTFGDFGCVTIGEIVCETSGCGS